VYRRPRWTGRQRVLPPDRWGATPVDRRDVAREAYRVRETLETDEEPTFVQL
jgi:hypothetical protein